MGCGIAVAHIGSSSRSMARERQPANALHRHRIGRPPRGACVPCVLLAIPDANGASRPHAYHCVASPYPSVACHLWQPWQRTVPRGIRRAVAAIQTYLKAYDFPEERTLLRLDGQYGTGAVLADLAGLSFVMRGKDYQLLDRAEVQARLHLPPDQQLSHPESGIVRTLYDCPDLPLGPTGKLCRSCRSILPPSERVGSASLARESSTSCSSPISPSKLSRLPMWWRSISIAVLSRCPGWRIKNKIPTAGVVMLPGVKSAGKSSRNGCGTSGWN